MHEACRRPQLGNRGANTRFSGTEVLETQQQPAGSRRQPQTASGARLNRERFEYRLHYAAWYPHDAIHCQSASCHTKTGRSESQDSLELLCSVLHLPHYIVPLAKEREPILKHAFLFVRQILPLGFAVFWFQ